MDLTITLTDAEVAALTRSNESANSDPETRPKLEQFIADQCRAKFAEHLAAWQDRDGDYLAKKLKASYAKLDPATIDAINTALDAKAAPAADAQVAQAEAVK